MNMPMNIPARTFVVDIAVTTPPYLPFYPRVQCRSYCPRSSRHRYVRVQGSPYCPPPAAADTGMFGCKAALIAPAQQPTQVPSGARYHLLPPRLLTPVPSGAMRTFLPPKPFQQHTLGAERRLLPPNRLRCLHRPYLAYKGNSESTSYWVRPRIRRIWPLEEW